MEKMEKIEIKGDTLYLKKSFDGWRIIYPYNNPDGSLNLKNIILGGNVWKFLKSLIVGAIMILLIYYLVTNINYCNNLINDNIEKICDTCNNNFNNLTINNFNLTLK